jgi:uncharacterized membrane protein (UPF0127 family)
MIVYNLTRGKSLAERADRAETFFARLKGLLGRRPLADGEGLWISPCRSVHSIGMRYPLDVLFLDGQGKVIGAIPDFPPMRLTRIFPEAKGALELPRGALLRTDTACGDFVEFRE